MKKVFILFLVFMLSSMISKGQDKPEDKYGDYLVKYFNFCQQEDPEKAIEVLSKIIQSDSSFYKIYFLRGYDYLYETESLIIDRDTSNDSSFIEQSIKDLKKGIELYFENPKDFPSNIVGFEEEYKIKSRDYIELGEKTLSDRHQDVIDGVMIYITTKRKNKKLACECWKKAKEKNVSGVDMLINEFCK